jgi:Cd2+/Zn2+-exporting ATPase
LTYGDFKVTKTVTYGMDERTFMTDLRAVESRSTHPIALAILGVADTASLASQTSEYKEYPGCGAEAVYEGHRLAAGNFRLLEQENIPVPEAQEVGTMVYLALDGKCVGYVVLNDVIRKESLDMVNGLKKFGIKTCMLTGDKEDGAFAVSSTLGITEHHSQLLPDDKRRLLAEKIEAHEGKVAYIGDGINDAPSIILADVGVAMGGVGSDLAVENADVVIMNDDPSKMVTAIKIAHKTKRKALANIIIALTVKLTIMVLSIVLADFPLLIAVLADTGLTVLLVLNSLTLLQVKKV